MIVTIGNCDYTAAFDAATPLSIERTLNAPSVCRLSLVLPAGGSPAVPSRSQSVAITGDNGVVYFTGYIAARPLPVYAGVAVEGPRYRFDVEAISDEILLDQALASRSKSASGLTAGALLTNLATHAAPGALSCTKLTLPAPVSQFTPAAGAAFSKSAGIAAAQVRAAYRAQSGVLSLNSIPGAVHALNEADGSLTLANLNLTRTRDFANDLTVCGEHEPAAYVTEIFAGDGVTSSFILASDPYFPPTSKAALITELFDQAAIDTRAWGISGSTSYFGIGSSGLAFNGGNGVDGQAQLSWMDPVEMGGTLLLEADGVTLAPGSTGLIAALFSGGQSASSCIAGFQAIAQQGTGAVSLQPLVNGEASGAAFPLDAANQYTLRIRIHCAEQQRTLATYLCSGDDGPVAMGGQGIAASAKLLFEIQEFVNGVAGMPVMLYDGAVTAMPAACTVIAASSINLHGAMRALHLTSLGSAWVVSKSAGGSAFTRRLGSAAQSAECRVERTGRLVFDSGYTPAAGEQVTVTYRTIGRAMGREVNAASQQALEAQGLPALASWIGSVTQPPCRSSADCRNAAAALAQAAASASALWKGTYRATHFDFSTDVWPGDALALDAPSCGLNAQLIVRSVKLSYRATSPDLVAYEIGFANDWAEDLAIRTSSAVPADTWLPAAAGPSYLNNLNALTVTSISGNTVTIHTGVTPPSNGGFEIRTRDHAFMPGEDPGLVMRASQQNLTFTRTSASDHFYVRIYDAADPPSYSEFSAELVFNLPLTA